MKTLLLIMLAITFSISSGCQGRKQDSSSIAPKEVIMFSEYKEELNNKLPNKFVTRKSYVNLEMNKDGGYVDMISKLYITGGKIYALDKRKKCIVVYDSDGRYIRRLAKLEEDYVNIADFDVDENGIIYLIDGKLDNILCYNSDFKLIYKRKSPYEIDVIQRLNNDSFLVGLSSWNSADASGEKIVLADKNLSIINTIAGYDEFVDDDFWISDYLFINTGDAIFYNRPVDNDVYKFSLTGKLQKKYHFDFGTMNVPDQDKKEIERKLSRYEKYRVLTDFTVVNSKVAFGKLWDKKQYKFFFIDRVGHILYLEDLSMPNELKHIVCYRKNTLTSFIYPGEYNKEAFKDLPVESQEHLKKGGIVICNYEIK